ncbi:MAG: 50S ribosomal protein L1 [Candidatus Aenigmatarchaeota archaeon]
MKIDEALKELEDKKRNFEQTYDLIINLKNIDLSKPENKIKKEIALPYGKGKPASVCVISEKRGFTKEKIEAIGSNKKEAKKFAKSYDFFLATPTLMPIIGKALGKYLAPKNKMPQPIPPNASDEEIEKIVKIKERSVRFALRSELNIQIPVGKEGMPLEHIKSNIIAAVKDVIASLPKGKAQIKNVMIKKTMSKPIKIDLDFV